MQKLDPEKAAQLGTELMGEFFIYVIISGLVYAEYVYTTKSNEIKEQKRKEEWNGMERKMDDMFMITERQEAELTELRRLVSHLEDKNRSLLEKFFSKEKKDWYVLWLNILWALNWSRKYQSEHSTILKWF